MPSPKDDKKRPEQRKRPARGRTRAVTPDDGFPVVGIGASAGALEACRQFFGSMPPDSGMAFVVILHLDPHHESMMPNLLARYTAMPVVQVKEAARIEPNRVYVIPPNRYLSLKDGALVEEPAVKLRGVRMPIDHFFRSLAVAAGKRAIGIVLSGTGSDGASGLKEIKGAGGMTIAQRPETAEFDGMARAALMTGMVDRTLGIEEIRDVLLSYARHPYIRYARASQSAEAIPPEHLRAITDILRFQTDTDFAAYKKGTLSRRIQRRMGLKQVRDPAHYVEMLRSDSDEVQQLFNDLLIGVTAFFREPESWQALEKYVVVPLIESRATGDPVRVWVAGCATGEEAFSVAILFHEQMARLSKSVDLKIFATDIDERAIGVARRALYPESVLAEVTPERLKTYFVREGEHFRVAKRVRESIVFAEQSLLSDPPFSRLDLISCRNVLMYFEPDLQRRVAEMFHFALQEGGFLALGPAESLSSAKKLFEPIDKDARLFRRLEKPDAGRNQLPLAFGYRGAAAQTAMPLPPNRHETRVEAAKRLLLERYAPAAVLVNGRGEAQYFHGPIHMYLHIPGGEPTTDIAEMAVNGLRTRLKTCLQRARSDRKPVIDVARRMVRNGDQVAVRITIEPVNLRGQPDFMLVSFTDERPAVTAEAGAGESAGEVPAGQAEAVSQIEHELYATRDDLQSTVEELETANEELKASNEEVMSMNEEIQSTNEELETSREELQSLNEELSTVNRQLEEKIAEVEKINNDVQNLLTSTRIATVFLGLDLHIRRFTPSCTELFRIIESDVGRPISDLVSRISDTELRADIDRVIDSLTPVEKEVQADSGHWFLRKILPYRTLENRIEGVVATYTDITVLKESAIALARRERQQAMIAELGRTVLARAPIDQLFESAANSVPRLLDCEFSKVLELLPGRNHLLLRAGIGWKPGMVGHTTIGAGRESHAGFALASGRPIIVEDFAQEKRFSSPAMHRDHGVVSAVSVIIGSDTEQWGALSVGSTSPRKFKIYDVSFLQAIANLLYSAIERERAEAARLEAVRLTRIATEAGRMGTWYIGVPDKRLTLSDELLELLGLTRDKAEGWIEVIEGLVNEADRERFRSDVAAALAKGPTLAGDYRVNRPDGGVRWIHLRGSVLRAPDDTAIEMYGVAIDITEQKSTEQRLRIVSQELDHRVKNILARFQAILDRSRERAGTVEDLHDAIASRINAMARTHARLSESHWTGVRLDEVIDDELTGFGYTCTVDNGCPDLVLAPEAAQAISMVLQELVTNALKHGALSHENGRIELMIDRLTGNGAAERCRMRWFEHDGPPAEEPERQGYGLHVIRELIAYELDGSVSLTFAPDGLRCEITAPLSRISAEAVGLSKEPKA